MADRTPDAKVVEYLKLKERLGSGAAACRALGDNFDYRAWNHLALSRGLTAATPIRDEKERLKGELAAAKGQVAMLQKEHDTAETIRHTIYKLAERTPEPPEWISAPHDASGFRGVPMTIWSDWHYGEVVRPEEVGGMNDFNAEVAQARIKRLVDLEIELCFQHMGRGKAEYPGIIVMLGGDMISGDIHEELFATNDRTPQQCINELTDLIGAGLEKMADAFGKVFVPCVVGNHGRASRKPRMKGRVYTSHEWNIYCNLERHFRKDKRIQFMIPNEADAFFKVYGFGFLLTHGDSLGVKGGDGIIGAIGPIMRGTVKLGNSTKDIGRDFDYVVMGHWHQMLWLPHAIVNGALKGFDEYAQLALRAPYSPPSQALWFVHPKIGITARWEVLLEPWKDETCDEWISWRAS